MKYSKVHLAKEAIKHKGFIKKIPDFFRMIKLWRKGVYPVKSWNILLPLFGLLYVISPIDVLPEIALPIVGVLDDIAVLALVIPKIMKEIDAFLEWEINQKHKNNSTVIEVEALEE